MAIIHRSMLHKTNKKPSIPLAFSTQVKESYTTLDDILTAIKYTENLWKICCDMKVENILQGLKCGYPKFFCYLCCWDTRDKDVDHFTHTWEKRKPGQDPALGVIQKPLIENTDDIFETVLKNNDDAFKFLKKVFPKLSDQKIRAGKI